MAGEAVPAPLTPVHFSEASGYFRSKVNLPTNGHTDLLHDAHTRGFSVAGATSAALLADFRGAVDKAIAGGVTLEQFRADFDTIVAKHGWSYRGGRNWRSRVIYETNVRMAVSAGRWQQIQRLKQSRPYLRYIAILDKRTRPEHRHWNDIILPVDHPWWKTHFPPNGWNCRCTVMSLSERDLTRYGLKVTDDPPVDMEPRRVRRPDGTFEIVPTPEGIDTGFGYNPGDSWMRGVTPPELRQPLPPPDAPATPPPPLPPLPLPPLPPVPPPAVPSLPEDVSDADAVKAFLARFGADIGKPVVIRDPGGTRIVISEELFRTGAGALKATKWGRGQFLPALADAILDPDEIWVDWLNVDPHGPAPRWVLRRRYIRRFQAGGNAGGLASFAWTKDGWEGSTVFPPERQAYLERQRRGALLYRREGT